MRAIAKQFLYLFLFSALIYSVIYWTNRAQYPSDQRTVIDTGKAPKIYTGTARQIVMDRELLRTASPKIIFIGSSNAREGFRPEQIKERFPGHEVHNLGVGAPNLTQVKKIIELIYEAEPAEAKSRTVFVLGFWYGILVTNQARWDDGVTTDIDHEKLRFGLYQKTGNETRPIVSKEYFGYYVKFLQPFLVFDNAFGQTKSDLKKSFEDQARFILKGIRTPKAPNPGDPDLDSVVVDQAAKERAFKFWREYMGEDKGGVQTEQLDVLMDIVRYVKDNGGKLVIVDLPIPAWHSDHSPYFHDFEIKKKPYIKQAVAYDGVYYVNLQALNKDDEFYDSAHPKPLVTKKWNQKISEELMEIIREKS